MLWIIRVSRFCWLFLSHSAEKFRRGTPVFPKCSGIEKFLDNKLSPFGWSFLSYVAENHRGRNFVCFRIFVVSKLFGYYRCHYSVDCFCLTVPKNFWRTLQWFKKIGQPKILGIIGEFHGFPFKTSSLTVPKTFVGERFCLSEKF